MYMLRSLERSLDPMSHTSYIETQVYSPMRQIHQDISTKSYYAEPAKAYIGKSLCSVFMTSIWYTYNGYVYLQCHNFNQYSLAKSKVRELDAVGALAKGYHNWVAILHSNRT